MARLIRLSAAMKAPVSTPLAFSGIPFFISLCVEKAVFPLEAREPVFSGDRHVCICTSRQCAGNFDWPASSSARFPKRKFRHQGFVDSEIDIVYIWRTYHVEAHPGLVKVRDSSPPRSLHRRVGIVYFLWPLVVAITTMAASSLSRPFSKPPRYALLPSN